MVIVALDAAVSLAASAIYSGIQADDRQDPVNHSVIAMCRLQLATPQAAVAAIRGNTVQCGRSATIITGKDCIPGI